MTTTSVSRRHIGQQLLMTALLCGVIGDQLLRNEPMGINLSAYMAVAIISTGVMVRMRLGSIPTLTWRFLLTALLFTAFIGVRGSEQLTVFNVIGAAAAVAFAVSAAVAAASPTFTFRLLRVRDAISAGVFTIRNSAIGAFGFLYHDAGNALAVPSVHHSKTRMVLRGVILAFVVVGAFTALLVAGDPVFASAVALPFQWDLEPLLEHLFLIGLFSWPILGMQWATTSGNATPPDKQLALLHSEWRGLNRVDVVSVLSALNVLFAGFVLVQIRVLFGGASYVVETTGLTMAEYARNGFFTLVAASGLVLVALLLIDAMFKDGAIAAWKSSQRLSFSLLLFVSVVLASAATRMTLYVNAFGGSIERYYCFGIMVWLTLVLLLFSQTVLRNRHSTFVMGTLVTAWMTLLAFNVVNLESLATRTNIDRFNQGARFDLAYARMLGADAVPPLVDGIINATAADIDRMDTGTAERPCEVIGKLTDDWTVGNPKAPRNWSVNVWRARKAVARNESALRLRSCVAAPLQTPTPPPTTPGASPSI